MSKGNEPYIIIAQQHWSLNLGSNARNLAIEFSKDREVLYVNPAIDIKSAFKEIGSVIGRQKLKVATGFENATILAQKNIWVHTPNTINYSISWIKNTGIYNFFNEQNAIGFFKSLRNAIKQIGWKKEECIVLNDSQMFTGPYTKKYLKPLLSFYYLRDNLVEHPYFKFHGKRVEPITIALADAVFANSAYLAKYAGQYHKISNDVGQGCELELYDANKIYTAPDDIKNIGYPRIGYIGFLTGERLNIDLLENLAKIKKDWQWVFIGPEEILFKKSKLHNLPNVHFLGTKDAAILPAYIQHLNVCLNPQHINALTVGNYPRKIDEYLAMGKPTVASATPAMEMFLPHVHLAKGTEEYIYAITNALKPVSKTESDSAILFAKSHTWRNCVNKIYLIQNKLLHARIN